LQYQKQRFLKFDYIVRNIVTAIDNILIVIEIAFIVDCKVATNNSFRKFSIFDYCLLFLYICFNFVLKLFDIFTKII